MRAVFASALAAFATAGKVHDFAAESNFICELCTKAVEFGATGQDDKLDNLYELFPALSARINTWYSVRNEVVDLTKPLETCQRMEMCETPDYTNYFYGEQLQNLEEIVKMINENTTSGWKAKMPEKFVDATL